MRRYLREVEEDVADEQKAGGEKKGEIELLAYPFKVVLRKCRELIEKKNLTLIRQIKHFPQHLKLAYAIFSHYSNPVNRKDMPVIDSKDVKLLQARLLKGILDVNEPWSPETDPKNPFPTGLTGAQAQAFLTRGLRYPDSHDRVDVRVGYIVLRKLKPIQRQVYVDKVLKNIQRFGFREKMGFIQGFGGKNRDEGYFIASRDGWILDGHHRFLSGLLMNPNIKARCLVIDLEVRKLYRLLLAYGDAIGNKRNE